MIFSMATPRPSAAVTDRAERDRDPARPANGGDYTLAALPLLSIAEGGGIPTDVAGAARKTIPDMARMK
jgi:hypothetical protein